MDESNWLITISMHSVSIACSAIFLIQHFSTSHSIFSRAYQKSFTRAPLLPELHNLSPLTSSLLSFCQCCITLMQFKSRWIWFGASALHYLIPIMEKIKADMYVNCDKLKNKLLVTERMFIPDLKKKKKEWKKWDQISKTQQSHNSDLLEHDLLQSGSKKKNILLLKSCRLHLDIFVKKCWSKIHIVIPGLREWTYSKYEFNYNLTQRQTAKQKCVRIIFIQAMAFPRLRSGRE